MPTSIRLPDNLESRLDFLAKKTGRTKAYYIREMIISSIADMEDYYLAADTVERVHKGIEKTFSAKHVRQALDLDN